MKYIFDFKNFLFESQSNIDWPDNWKDLLIWKELENIGFRDETTPRMAKNGSILLKNDEVQLYPEGIVLTKTGYIRRQGVQGYVKQYKGDYSLDSFLHHVYSIYKKHYDIQKDELLKNELSKETISILSVQKNKNWDLNKKTGRIDVNGSINIEGKLMGKKIPNDLRFGIVTGSFNCGQNGLTNLDIAPIEVGKDFICGQNKLKSLKGSPKIVGGDFNCWSNQIEYLSDLPKKIKKLFCGFNKITDVIEPIDAEDIICHKNPISEAEIMALAYRNNYPVFMNKVKAGEIDLKSISDIIPRIIEWIDVK